MSFDFWLKFVSNVLNFLLLVMLKFYVLGVCFLIFFCGIIGLILVWIFIKYVWMEDF